MTSPTSQERARTRRLKIFFNLSVEDWDRIDTFQRGCCAACGKPQKSGKRLATDHDHRGKGLIRGLLCSFCNRILGKIERAWGKDVDVIMALEGLLQFLKNPPAVQALGKEVYTFPGRFGTKRHKKYLQEQKGMHQ